MERSTSGRGTQPMNLPAACSAWFFSLYCWFPGPSNQHFEWLFGPRSLKLPVSNFRVSWPRTMDKLSLAARVLVNLTNTTIKVSEFSLFSRKMRSVMNQLPLAINLNENCSKWSCFYVNTIRLINPKRKAYHFRITKSASKQWTTPSLIIKLPLKRRTVFSRFVVYSMFIFSVEA